MLNTAILSDLHLGEPYGLLRDQGVPPVLDLIQHHGEGQLRRLVLCGDVFEMSTPESMDAVASAARMFFGQARARLHLGEVVWVPGNHDHSLLREHLPQVLVTDGAGVPAPRSLIDRLFGPGCDVPVRVAYPHLQLFCPRSGKNFIIHHGHLMDDLVLGRSTWDRISAHVSARLTGTLFKPSAVDLDRLRLDEVEALARPTLEKIWRHHDDARNLQTEAWDLLRRTTRYAPCHGAPDAQESCDEAALMPPGYAANAPRYLGAARRTPGYRGAGEERALTLLFGHTHSGGSAAGELSGVPYRALNLGGWVPELRPTRDGHKAHTHVYLLNDDLEDRMVSAPLPDGWAARCMRRGWRVFEVPGGVPSLPSVILGEQDDDAPAPGLSVAVLDAIRRQPPFGRTQAQHDPFAT